MTSAVSRPIIWLCSLACIAVLGATPGVGDAKPKRDGASKTDPDLERAKKLFYQGRKLFDLRRFDQALAKYEAAFEAKAIPEFLFNIGQCHRNLDNYDEAIFSFRRFLQLEPETPRREQIEALIAELEAKRQQADDDARKLPLIPPDDRAPTTARPVYKKWWFWTGIAVVGVAGGAGIYAATRTDGPPDTNLGNIVFTK